LDGGLGQAEAEDTLDRKAPRRRAKGREGDEEAQNKQTEDGGYPQFKATLHLISVPLR
jgi:hypothetical protein